MTHLKISQRRTGSVVILDLDGRITLGEGSTEIRDSLRKLMDGGAKKILFNLKDMNYMDSSGLGELVSADAMIARHGGELKLVNLPARVQSVLHITKLATVFETFDSEHDAVRSFARASVLAKTV
jgi:anti-sigma B factor antagonist